MLGRHTYIHTYIHTAEALVPGPSDFDTEVAFQKLKRHRSPNIDQISPELLKQRVEKITLRSINLFIPFGIRRNRLRSGRSR
jgi:hypothetical protein